MTTYFENFLTFKPVYSQMQAGTTYVKVKHYDDSGTCIGTEYTTDPENDLNHMTEVGDGYFTETYRCTKRQGPEE